MDREKRLAAAKKKLNAYKQQQYQDHSPPPAVASSYQSHNESSSPGSGSLPMHTPTPTPPSPGPGPAPISPPISQLQYQQSENQHHYFDPTTTTAAAPIGYLTNIAQNTPPLPPLDNSIGFDPIMTFPPMLSHNQQPPPPLTTRPSPPSSVIGSSGHDIVETHRRTASSSSASALVANHLPSWSVEESVPTTTAPSHVLLMNPSSSGSFGVLSDNALISTGSSNDVAAAAPATDGAPALQIAIDKNSVEQPVQVMLTDKEQEQEMVNRVNNASFRQPPPEGNSGGGGGAEEQNPRKISMVSAPAAEEPPILMSHSRNSSDGIITNQHQHQQQYQYPKPTFRRHPIGGVGVGPPPPGRSGSPPPPDDDEKLTRTLDSLQLSSLTSEVYELQLSQLRQDNSHLQQRESDLLSQLQQLEHVNQSLRRQVDELKQELTSDSNPTLKTKLSSLYNTNGVLKEQVQQLEKQLEMVNERVKAKVDNYNEMEQALIVINKGKMELAAKLDVESEVSKELRERFDESQRLLAKLSDRNLELESILSSHQLQLERLGSLEEELKSLRKRLGEDQQHFQLQQPHDHDHGRHEHSHGDAHDHHHDHHQGHEHGHAAPVADGQTNHHDDHDHAHCNHEHDHNHHPTENGNHNSDNSQHEKMAEEIRRSSIQFSGHGHSHSHSHSEGGSETGHGEHDHDHDHPHPHPHPHPHEDPKSPSAMEKKLARLEWENASFREELDRLAELLKIKTADSNQLANYKEDNEILKKNLNQAEHLVVQLSSENDTIGDYIALYQTQRLALKERALEKENELASLSIEREKLRGQMEQLNSLLQAYHCKLEEGTAGGEIETNAKQINELVLGINSTFHPCSMCSGSRLMNV